MSPVVVNTRLTKKLAICPSESSGATLHISRLARDLHGRRRVQREIEVRGLDGLGRFSSDSLFCRQQTLRLKYLLTKLKPIHEIVGQSAEAR